MAATLLVAVPHASALESFQPATNVIGQNDGLTGTPGPIFTKGTANNAAHKLGLSNPMIGMVIDTTDHRLFLSDTSNHRVLVYDLDGSNLLIDRVPDYVIGQANFWANALAITQAGLNTPNGITFDDANNRLFVAQGLAATSARVTVYDVTSITNGEDAVNVLGQTSFTVSAAASTQDGLRLPMGIDYDATNSRLYVVNNTGNRVTVYDVSTIEDGEAAINVLGQADFTTITAASTQAGLSAPIDVIYDSANSRLFVSDGTNHRVLVFDTTVLTDGESAVNVLGQTNFTNVAAATTQAGMNAPRGMAYDDADEILYVAQLTANRVTVYDVSAISNGEDAINVLGQATFTVSTAATTQAGLNGPVGALLDEGNNLLYVQQSTANRVSVFNVAAITNGEDATDVLGQSDSDLSPPGPIFTKATANNGPHKLGLSAPQGIALDTINHRLFVADSSNNRVLVYNMTTGNMPSDLIPDFVLGQANFHTNAVATTQAGLSLPTGLTFDGDTNRLFVSDFTNNRIVVYDTTSITDGENAINVIGQINFTTATAGTTQQGLSGPREHSYDPLSGHLFVADTTNNRVIIFTGSTIVDGQNAINVLGQNDGLVGTPSPIFTKGAVNNGPHKLGLSAPTAGIVMDKIDHRLFVTDSTNNRILVYNLDNNNVLLDLTPDNVIGQLNFYTSAAGSTRNGLNAPNGIDYDPTGKRLFVAQITGNRVSIFDVATIVDGEDAVNVLGQTTYTAITAASTQVGLNVPTGVAYDDANDRLFVAQSTGNRVSVFDLSTGFADYMNAENALGQNDALLSSPSPIYTKTTANNGPNKLGLSAPGFGIAVDTVDHRLFVADTSNVRILVYNLDSNNDLLDRIPDNVLGQVNFYTNAVANTQAGLAAPNGLAYDNVGKRLFVADGSGDRVKVFDVTSITDGELAAYVLGQVTFAGTTAAVTQVGMTAPVDVAYDSPNKRLFVSNSNRVTVYDVTTISNGENAINVLGQANFTASSAATTQAGMNVPQGLAYDSAGQRLFVSQDTANRVTVYDVAAITDGESAINVLGQGTFTVSTAATTQAGMAGPRGMTHDSTTNYLYVAQTTADRVTVYDVAAITDGENAINVLGQANFTGTVAQATQAGMSATTGVAMDEANSRLYVAQSGANRVTIFDVSTITDGEDAVDALGQYDSDLVTPGPVFTKGAAHNGPNNMGLSAPIVGMALDPTDHRLFVSDTSNNRVLVYNLDSNDVPVDRIPDNVLGQANFHSNTAATTQERLAAPYGLSYDDTNNRLFVAESASNRRVTVFDVTAITDGEDAINVLGQTNFTSNVNATSQTGMSAPSDVLYDATTSRLFVADAANRVIVYDVTAITDGENAINVLGQATFTTNTAATTQAGMNVPYGLALSGSTVLFVSQGTGNRVTTYDVTAITDGENAVNVLGQATFTATTAATTQAGMNAPRGISYDEANKKLYVAQTTGARVTVYDVATITDGENAVNVIGQALFTTSTALVDQQGLSAPTGVLVDPDHDRVYVLDSTTNRVLMYNTTLGIGNGENAVNVLGQASFTASTAATTQAGMNVPLDLALSGSTALFVSQSTGNRVTVYDVTALTDGESAINVLGQTTFTTSTAASTQAGMNAPRGLAYDAVNKRLYVGQTTGNRVTVYDVAAITNGENAIKVLGQPNFIQSTASTRQAGLNVPTGVYIDTTNNKLYVPQSGAHRVSVFDTATIADGENAASLIGQYDSELNPPGPIYTKGTANNGPYKLGLSAPQGIALDNDNHRLFVSDSSNNRILVYNLTSGNVPIDNEPDNVLGQLNYHSNAVATTQIGLSLPTGIAFDEATNRLYASDFTNNRILVYDTTSITDGESAVYVLGQPHFALATAGITQLGLSGPRQLVYDGSSGQLFVADATNNRIITYSVSPPDLDGDSFHFFGF